MKRLSAVFGLTALITVLSVLTISDTVPFFLLAAAALFSFTAVILRDKRMKTTWLFICAAICVSFLSAETACRTKLPFVTELDGKTCTVTGTAADYPSADGDRMCVKIKSCDYNGEHTGFGVAYYGSRLEDISPGDIITISDAKLVSVGKDNAFFFHSLSQDVYFHIFSGSPSVTHGKRQGFVYDILTLRRFVSNRLKLSLSTDAFPIAEALITGGKDNLGDAFISNLQISGASHIFAVSGMHLSLWTLVLFAVFGVNFGIHIYNNIIGMIFVLFFTVFTGESPSVIRAAIMLMLVFAGNILRKPTDGLNSLGISTAVCVIANPFSALNASFLLSTLATAAVIISMKYILRVHKSDPKLILKKCLSLIINPFIISSFALVFTLPVMSYFFGRASLLSGLSSVLCTLPAEGIMLSGVFGIFFFGTKAGRVLFFVCDRLGIFILTLTERLSRLDFFVVPLDEKQTAILTVTLFICVCVTLSLTLSERKRAAFLSSLIVICLALAFSVLHSAFEKPKTEIYVSPDGDILITENNGAVNAVIDSGGTYESRTAIREEMVKYGRVNADLLIVPPGVRVKQNSLSEYSPSDTVIGGKTTLLADKNEKFSDITLTLSEYTTLRCVYTDCFYGCICTSCNIKTVFVFSDKNAPLPPEFLSAECMIFKNGMPENAEKTSARKFILSDDTSLTKKKTDIIRITVKGGDINAGNK